MNENFACVVCISNRYIIVQPKEPRSANLSLAMMSDSSSINFMKTIKVEEDYECYIVSSPQEAIQITA